MKKTPGPKARPRSKADFARLGDLQKKLNILTTDRNLSEVAREMGIPRTTLGSILEGSEPKLPTARKIVSWMNSQGAGISLTELQPRVVFSGIPFAGRSVAAKDVSSGVSFDEDDEGLSGTVGMDAVDPRALLVQGKSAFPLADHGQVLVFDAGRPGEVANGDAVVAEIDGELVVKRRYRKGGTTVFQSINESNGFEPIIKDADEVTGEYPIVAIILRPLTQEDGH